MEDGDKMAEHVSVLLQEAVDSLNVKSDGIYVDMTLGGGGHSLQILKRLDKGRLFCFDQDTYAINIAKENLMDYTNVTFIHSNFENLVEKLHENGIQKVDGLLFDLGVSSFQFDLPERGFSYHFDAPLDMRMDQSLSLSARVIVNEYSYDEIVRVLFEYGEEPFAKSIARRILEQRQISPIETTSDLVDIIKKSLPSKILKKKGHPAKQTFQALRIEVNNELGSLKKAMDDAIRILNPGGRIVVITFHSLEDRICKKIFKSYSEIDVPKGLPIIITEIPILALINKKVILPSEEELAINNRAHSAKMRVVQKIHD